MNREAVHEGVARRWRRRLLRRWLACAVPWLAVVAGILIHDHARAIRRTAMSHLPPLTNESPLALLSDMSGLELVALCLRWVEATIAYCGEAFAFYGLLPASLTFALYVVFLPWADRWASQGTIQD